LRPDVPASLSRIVQQAMARDPALRYRSARVFARELRDWIEQEGAELTDEGLPDKPWLAPRRLGTVAASLAVVGALAWWLNSEPSHEATETAAAATTTSSTAKADAASAAPMSAPANPSAAATVVAAAPAVQPAEPAPSAAEPEPPATKAQLVPSRPTRPTLAAPRERSNKPQSKTGTPVKQPGAPGKTPGSAAATGVVQLAISPWGRIEVNGSSAGVTPPLAKLTLPAGEHVVTVRNEDFPPYTARVKVAPNEAVTVRHRFGS
jgi:serine/threonine-protein kinase